MDDLRMVREAYGEPAPPAAGETAAARALMLEDAPRARVRSGRRGLGFGFGWRVGAGVGVVAAGAAVAVAVASTGSGSGSPAPRAPVDLGKGAVLAAAEKAELQPTGKYWFDDIASGQAYVVRAKTGTYAIFGAHAQTFHWTGVKSGMGEAYYGRDLPAHPQTARDAALWRAAGSPSSIRVWSGDKFLTFTTRATKWTADGPNVGVDPRGGGRFLDDKSVEELRKLPTAPDALAKLFLDGKAMAPMAGPGRKVDPRSIAALQIMRSSAVLSAPVPSKVRSGMMKALAAEPGVHEIGHVTDPLGRPGVALANDDRATTETGEFGSPKADWGTYRSRVMVVFDERTGALLSTQRVLTVPGGPYRDMKPGFVLDYQAGRSGWTDTKPKPPAELPF